LQSNDPKDLKIVDAQSAVSLTLKSDRTCKYCSKEFQYPCRLKQHMKAKNFCSINSLPTNDSVLTVNNSVLPTNDSVLTKNNNEKTVPVRLSLAQFM
jgi:hypothetical protein